MYNAIGLKHENPLRSHKYALCIVARLEAFVNL